MSLVVTSDPIPLTADSEGVVRVSGTRVTLDTVVGAYCDGQNAEEIVRQYPVLSLGDVYAVLGYFLRNRAAVESYLAERELQAAVARRENESRHSPKGVRSRLVRRITV